MRLSQPTLPVDETRLNSFLSRMQDLNRLLEIHFAAITVERGRRYQQRAHVLSWHWESDPPTLSGAVRGTGDVPYNVRVQFDWTHNIDLAHIHDSDVESYCNCPVGRQCKHAVALILEAMPRLLLLASKQQRPNGAPTGQAAKLIELFGNAAQPADPDAKAVGQAEAWLSTLRPSERASTPARQPSSMRLLYNVAARTLPTAAFLPDQETAQPRTPRQPVQTLQARAWLRHNDDRWQSGPVHLFRRHLVPKAVMDARDVECLQALAAAARDHKEALKDPDGMSLS
ncbi:MAG: SWIM zinc finger family protein, partial [Polyangiales bacterium]